MKLTLLRGGNVFSGVSNCGIVRADVLLEDKHIRSVGTDFTLNNNDAETVDVSGCCVLPGLINIHEHLIQKRTYGPPFTIYPSPIISKQMQLPDAFLVIRAVRAALRNLRDGVTTIREVGAKNDISFAIKRAIDIRAIPGPRIVLSRQITSLGGHGVAFGRAATGPYEFRAAAREAISDGADWVKVKTSKDPVRVGLQGQHTYPEVIEEELAAVVDETHRWCKKVCVHAIGSVALAQAIRCRPDTIEHGIYLDTSLARSMAESKIALIPTLSGYHQPTRGEFGRGADWIALHQLIAAPHRASFRAALEAGVTMGVGTDTLGDYVEELQMMVELGMDAQTALESATRVNATILGLEDEIGTLESGKTADLVVVRGDPLTDLEALRDVVMIVKDGEALTRQDVQLCTDDESAEWNTIAAVDP